MITILVAYALLFYHGKDPGPHIEVQDNVDMSNV